MNFEILGESLKLAVDEAFAVTDQERADTTAMYQQLNLQLACDELGHINASQITGLRLQVAEAYMSGDWEEIKAVQVLAHSQAIRGIARTILREKVQQPQKNRFKRQNNSTISKTNRRMGQ